MDIPRDIAANFAAAFDARAAADLAARLACSELDALAGLLTALGREDLAAAWIGAHAAGDDEGDDHYAMVTV